LALIASRPQTKYTVFAMRIASRQLASSPPVCSRVDPCASTEHDARVRVLVVVPVLNEAAHIRRTLSCLAHDSESHVISHMVVVDGGSSDGSPAIVEDLAAEEPRLHLLHNPARIQSAAVNLAVQRFGTHADVLVRCDAHAVYPEKFCERLVLALEQTGADAVVVPMDSIGSGGVQRAVAWSSNSVIGNGGAAHRGGRRSGFVDHGHHAAFRLDVFRKAGGYDETFTHNEDAELDCRQRALGGTIYLAADIRLGYHPRSTMRELARQYFRYGAGRSRTVRRHPATLRLRQLLVPLHLVAMLVAILLSLWAPWFLALPAFYALVLAIASVGFLVHHQDLAGLLAGPATAVMHTAWASGFFWGLAAYREPRWSLAATVPLRAGEPTANQVVVGGGRP
jgi:succinoglycan biosynthesis protein ExoA